MVVVCGEHRVGLLVGALHSVAKFNVNQINPTPLVNEKKGSLIKNMIKTNDGNLLIQCVDIDYLLRMLTNPFDQVHQQ